MESVRQLKVARLLQKELGEIFQKNAAVYLPGALISVTIVRISPDLSVAKVYLSIFPVKNKEESLKHLQNFGKEIRWEVSRRVKNQLRIVPELVFRIDDSIDHAARIDELLKK